ncbi:hypothetical protein [Thalassotalea agarivorans]|uniref:Uncharacterized protein n=1 Tax=Thalassotalea agarivorans TaxID=349064 RepID=A0A1H9ZFW5_THASX|nr:hypothetical protein [Thalassotalea agarivorans]SES80424.1 hypothetical protein SAMN05660429_00433 [Thalassotalea agarivorans]
MNKLAAIAGVILLACTFLLWGLAGSSLNPYVTKRISELAPIATGKTATIDNVDINEFEGKANLYHLVFRHDDGSVALSIDDIKMKIDVDSLKEDVITVKEVVLVNTVYDNTGNNDTVEQMIANIDSYLANNKQTGYQPTVAIKRVSLRGTAPKVGSSALSTTLSAKNAPISKTEIPNGLPVEESFLRALRQVLVKVREE